MQSSHREATRRQRAALALTAALLTIGTFPAAAQDSETAPAELPAELAEKSEGLSSEQLEFLRGEDALAFAERHEILFERLARKSPEEIEAYVEAMMRVTELSRFDPETDRDSVPLRRSDYFNAWRVRRPPEFDTPREAGPINVNRYLSAGAKNGIPTFLTCRSR